MAKYDILMHIVKPGVNIAGYLSEAPTETTDVISEEDLKTGFNQMQKAVATASLEFFVLYTRDPITMLGDPQTTTVLLGEVIVREDFYKDAAINMQLVKHPEVA